MPGAPTEIAWNAGHAIRPLTPREFALFQGLIHREAGIHLSEAKQALFGVVEGVIENTSRYRAPIVAVKVR